MTQEQNSKQDAIQWYLDHGFVLFPLHGKIPPAGLHWRQVEFDPFFETAGNFGVQLSAEDLVIDVDPRNGGDISFIELGFDFESFTVLTGSGGRHVYLKKPADYKTRKSLKEYPGIDFISEGGYVVGFGSIHPNTGKAYSATSLCKSAKAPKELLEIINKINVELTKGTDTYVEDDQTKERYIDYLKFAPLATSGEAGNATTFSVAASGRDFGLSEHTTFELILEHYNRRCLPPWSGEELFTLVRNAFKYAKGSIGSKSPAIQFEVWTEEKIEQENKEINKYLQRRGGIIKANLNNTAILFNENFPVPTLHHLLGYNEFTNNIEFLRPAPWHRVTHPVKSWSDDEAILCKYFMSNMWKFEPTTNLVHEAALKVAKDKRFHPVREYLQDLKWDGVRRCHQWLSEVMGAADNMYTREVGLKFLVAAVKRIFEPGCKFDYLLTLEGKQGTYKSTVFEILATRKDWYADPNMDIMNKDSVFMLFGKWIVEMPEMQTHFRAETTAMKGFLSRSVDRARMPYGRIMADFPRQCVFGGTINPENDTDLGWLKDTTGNRRYWPVQVGEVKMPNLDNLRLIVHQLWAEAYQLYLDGVNVYLDDAKLIEMAQVEQNRRLGRDPWQESIETWIDAPQNIVISIFPGDVIFKDCIGGSLDQYGVKEMSRVAKVMTSLGWEKGVFWSKEEGKSIRGYKRPSLI